MKPARVLALILVCALTATTAVGGQSFLFRATDLGPVNAASPIEITLWMKLHDQQGLDALVAAQQSGKAGYLSSEQVRAQHAPSPAEVARVADFLKAHGFAGIGVGQDNLFVRATGTVGLVQSAFNVELHQYNLYGRTFRASSRKATLPTALVPLVSAVGGLSDLAPEPQVARVAVKAATSIHTAGRCRGHAPAAAAAQRPAERPVLLGAVLLPADPSAVHFCRRHDHRDLHGQPLRRTHHERAAEPPALRLPAE